jgi:hypothetical protein
MTPTATATPVFASGLRRTGGARGVFGRYAHISRMRSGRYRVGTDETGSNEWSRIGELSEPRRGSISGAGSTEVFEVLLKG